MDNAEPSSQSSLDSLRTVEFRQTLRGYHIDDVDEYLERVAVDVEALQEQLRVAGERLRQAADRIAVLEQQLDEARRQPSQPVATAPSDEALHRTLQMAQRFVEQTRTEALAEAEATVNEARQRASDILSEAEAHARRSSEEAQRQLREDVARLEQVRGQLAADVETMARHLEAERTRLRAALGELTSWVEEKLQPAAALLAARPADAGGGRSGSEARPVSGGSGAAGGRPGGPEPSTGVVPEAHSPTAETGLMRIAGPGAEPQ
jgi:cell division initiation protein